MTTFKVGDLVIPKNKEERVNILRQSEDMLSFPCRVVHSEGHGRDQFLQIKGRNGELVGLYAFRFIKEPPIDKLLEDYM